MLLLNFFHGYMMRNAKKRNSYLEKVEKNRKKANYYKLQKAFYKQL